ncbi:MAG: ATP-binding protein [Bacteroidales bacterium]|nr:ATP-binding protein [Bacteroidales bacterium]
MKLLPYGVSDFKLLRRDNMMYVDKTMYLPLLEEEGNYLFMIRPRRFGKTLFLNMMEAYYDIKEKDNFQELFGGLWIADHPTSRANIYQVLRLDFSRAGGSIDRLEEVFGDYCCKEFDKFILKYKEYYDDYTLQTVLSSKSAESKLNTITISANRLQQRLYLIIDEYDNFTNDVLSRQGRDAFHALTHAEGFYRRFFKLFKGAFERILMMGISPVTLDDLTSGYNIDWNISQTPRFNAMLGFEEREVRAMLQYYRDEGCFSQSIDAIIEDMKPWYDNYCFALRSYDRETVYNCDMAIYYLKPLLLEGLPPENMVDKNIKTDYSKLQALIELDRGISREARISDIERIANEGYLDMRLATSFPALELMKDDNFRSLIYYYGMLTIGGYRRGRYHMVIPNECVRQQYWRFVIEMYQRIHRMDLGPLTQAFDAMVFNGRWEEVFRLIGERYRELSSVRDARGGEFNVQGFCKAMLGICDYTLLCPELELNYGYCDFLMLPMRTHFPDATHAYLIELKYVKADAPAIEEEKAYAEAEEQIRRYADDPRLKRATAGCHLHGLTVLFRGVDMKTPRVVIP